MQPPLLLLASTQGSSLISQPSGSNMIDKLIRQQSAVWAERVYTRTEIIPFCVLWRPRNVYKWESGINWSTLAWSISLTINNTWLTGKYYVSELDRNEGDCVIPNWVVFISIPQIVQFDSNWLILIWELVRLLRVLLGNPSCAAGAGPYPTTDPGFNYIRFVEYNEWV